MIAVPEYILTLQPYKAGSQLDSAARRNRFKKLINLASNENPLGTSPKVLKAITDAASTVSRYPDPNSSELVDSIASKYNKEPEQVICGHGSESLIAHIVNAFSEVSTELLTASGTFEGAFQIARKLGRKLNLVPLKDYGYDLEGILNNITANTRIIYISNPNNPTGSMIIKDEIEPFLEKVPKDIVVVLDEAYSIYSVQHEGYPNGLEYDYHNLIVLRTFSKTHGLAGLRVGYGIGPKELITTLYKVKLLFEPNCIAQKAAAAALQDEEFIKKTVEVNTYTLQRMTDKFDELSIEYIKPAANFVMILLPSEELAAEFCTSCLEHGILVRHVNSFGVPNGVRINTGTKEETEYALTVFEEVYKRLIKA